MATLLVMVLKVYIERETGSVELLDEMGVRGGLGQRRVGIKIENSSCWANPDTIEALFRREWEGESSKET